MQRRPDFSFPGSPARGLPPHPAPPRYGGEDDDEEVRWLQASLQASPDHSSGTPSPQLWAAPHHHHPHPLDQHLHRLYPASAGSSPSRAQAIAGYRREMLDLVRGLPESAYELSLRDIVERPAPAPAPVPQPQPSASDAAAARRHTDTPAPGGGGEPAAGARTKDAVGADGQAGSKGKRQGRKQRAMRRQRSRSLERSVSLDTGLLIKLFLPLSIAARKKVSPKPDAAKDAKKKKQGNKKKKQETAPPAQEEEWWTKSEFSDAGGSSRTSSSNSSAASVRNVSAGANPRAPARSWSRKRTGCYAFFRANKGKNGVNQD